MTKKCQHCGAEIDDNAVRCYSCKEWVEKENSISFDMNQREFLPTILLSFFLGNFGAHRFYTGYLALGILQLFTFGGCGIWALIDFLCICFNNFKDAENRVLKNYDRNIGIVFFVIFLIPIVLILLLLLFLFLAMAVVALGKS